MARTVVGDGGGGYQTYGHITKYSDCPGVLGTALTTVHRVFPDAEPGLSLLGPTRGAAVKP
ncbi:uncharacterized protein PpBr36_06413 [Pyricularia pennisetigena]|uniref:uncharacterized protein n=1 Tax=Pyricularia pennisetigena TaxID=1578925 RepID=UPI0011516139|nr:uncharacterized protein PpBr36_06413 [Pyricularia pennisetigena]TLS22818.1 hypothetical protein PpBr36_06413 [Pyricularia pennisetigena]